MNCSECKHWQVKSTSSGEIKNHFCERLSFQQKWIVPEPDLTGIFEISGSDTPVCIWTAANFGCNLGEAK